ncbi:MAG: hypothetical protein ACJ8BW_35420 [Ktedonobacteraceae bacterium]
MNDGIDVLHNGINSTLIGNAHNMACPFSWDNIDADNFVTTIFLQFCFV